MLISNNAIKVIMKKLQSNGNNFELFKKDVRNYKFKYFFLKNKFFY